MSASSLVNQGFYGYQSWGDAEADADFARTGGAGKGGQGQGGGSQDPMQIAQQYADSLIKAQEAILKRETDFLEGYTKTNPFVFDEALAKKSATAEYQPYYSELLDDYVKGVDLQRETTRGEANLLTTMQKLDTGARTRAYDQAVAKAEEGFAGQGLFFSGIKQRAIGEQTVESQAGQEGSTARYNNQQEGLSRQLTGYDINQQQKTRDIGREQEYSIEGGILQRKKEATAQYYTPLEQSYYRQFPSSSGSALKGYTVPEYFRV